MSFKHAEIELLDRRYRHFFLCLLIVIILWATGGIVIRHYLPEANETHKVIKRINLEDFASPPEERITSILGAPPISHRSDCTHHTCFNVYRCGHGPSLRVYIYPPKRFLDAEGIPISGFPSREYYHVLEAILNSRHYEPDPSKACLFVPSLDTLNQNRFRPLETSQALQHLPCWGEDGENHLIFNMVAGAAPDYSSVVELSLGRALVAGAGFDSWTYQPGFDVSLPVYSPLASLLADYESESTRPWLVVSAQTNLHIEYQSQLAALAKQNPAHFLVLSSCGNFGNSTLRCQGERIYQYPLILQRAVFCLIIRGVRLGQPTLLESLAAGCIPVILADTLVMPFSEVIDWRRAAIFVQESDLSTVLSRLRAVSNERRNELRQQGRWLYEQYFSSMKRIVLTTLSIIEDRVFPHNARSYPSWNLPVVANSVQPPLFLPLTAPRAHGFTAVVLTYDRVESLFQLVTKLSLAPSLAKILVLWNNQNKSPPPAGQWPKLSKPVRVIRTQANKLSNRFYPYLDIETEAILTIDDDIVMLTADEVEFGYEVWREFPDRIVGFPSRTHIWDNTTGRSWRYESEWTNHISLVLTGAAFHHKYWSYLYTTSMPGNIKEWVDDHMNCEDIAMNFLVANLTRKAPIKVTPRKKFKCPECTNTEMLSADINHMAERSQCVDRFASVYGAMPLQTVEFRADPVLYRDNFPEKLKRFNDMGSL
ncbi:hypothetical protein B566_EDAN003102 [Ephemera danica]|nr:hypothetical protein B566_EDAN003102 [Ephemera danica]